MKKRLLLDLLLTFMKIGLFTFGGGYAMIGIIEDICVNKKRWISHDEMLNVVIIAESTPGPMAINCATYVGFHQAGFIGSIFSTLGLVLPSFIVIYLISMFLSNFLEITLVANAFSGIRVAVGVIIVNAGYNMYKKMKKSHFPMAVFSIALVIFWLNNIFTWQLSSIALLVLAALVSLVFHGMKGGASR